MKPSELPEYITINAPIEGDLEILLPFEIINSSKCPKCDMLFDSMLITNNGRHEGMIQVSETQKVVWKNQLPKDRIRSIKILDENLKAKIDKHMERHQND